MAGKFKQQAEAYSINLSQLFTRSIRASLVAGITAATKETAQDSSNAAAHWLLAVAGAGKRSLGPWGRLRDLRGRRARKGGKNGKGGKRAKKPTYPVGYREDKGKNRGATLEFVRERALKDVIDSMVTGRRPASKFFLYNAAGGNEQYEINAGIDAAGKEGLLAVERVLARQVAAGRTRKVPLK